jgi:RNA ligase
MADGRQPFPAGLTAAECRAAIVDRPEFRESKKVVLGTQLTVFNYDFCHRGTFPDPEERGISPEERRRRQVLRECRGVVFGRDVETTAGEPSSDEVLVARRFHKFFNVDQNDEVSRDKINWDRPFTILEKLDGSLVSPLLVSPAPPPVIPEDDQGKDEGSEGTITEDHAVAFARRQASIARPCIDGKVVRWGSKQGPTDVTFFLEQTDGFIDTQLRDAGVDYDGLARECLSSGLTPLFEWCSLKNHIVLEYEVDQLGLLAIRDNETGSYFDYDQMRERAGRYRVPVTRRWVPDEQQRDLSGEALIDHFQETLKTVQNIEGYVICFYAHDEVNATTC